MEIKMKVIKFTLWFLFSIILLIVLTPWIFSFLELIGPWYTDYTIFVYKLFGH